MSHVLTKFWQRCLICKSPVCSNHITAHLSRGELSLQSSSLYITLWLQWRVACGTQIHWSRTIKLSWFLPYQLDNFGPSLTHFQLYSIGIVAYEATHLTIGNQLGHQPDDEFPHVFCWTWWWFSQVCHVTEMVKPSVGVSSPFPESTLGHKFNGHVFVFFHDDLFSVG